MFLKQDNSNMENGFKKFKMSPEKIIYIGNWKLEKTLSERHQNNTVMGVDYLT